MTCERRVPMVKVASVGDLGTEPSELVRWPPMLERSERSMRISFSRSGQRGLYPSDTQSNRIGIPPWEGIQSLCWWTWSCPGPVADISWREVISPSLIHMVIDVDLSHQPVAPYSVDCFFYQFLALFSEQSSFQMPNTAKLPSFLLEPTSFVSLLRELDCLVWPNARQGSRQ